MSPTNKNFKRDILLTVLLKISYRDHYNAKALQVFRGNFGKFNQCFKSRLKKQLPFARVKKLTSPCLDEYSRLNL